jgi:hypothetical protein
MATSDNERRTPFDFSGFSSTLNARISAEARINQAKAFGINCAGIGACLALWGLGAALSFYGYSKNLSPSRSAEIAATAISDAFAKAQVKAIVAGTMSLAPGSELQLAEGQSVSLDERSTVKLDPDSTVKVIGDFKVDIPQPSKQQLQLETTSTSKELPFTRYTVFRSTPFNAGSVTTGWNFELSDPTTPTFQRCYYEETFANNLSVTQTIAINGMHTPPSSLNKLTFDFNGAVSNCVWFSG